MANSSSTGLIKNGSFSSGSIDYTTQWFIPTDWEVSWSEYFYGTLHLESVGPMYSASNALLFGYTPAEDEWEYDDANDGHFVPGIYQIINLRNIDLSEVSSFVFKLDACLDYDNYEGITESEIDIYIYEVANESSLPNFNDYLLRRTFEVTALPDFVNNTFVWNTLNIEMVSNYLGNKMYMICITPHVDITGVAYDNSIVQETHVVIDNISLFMNYEEDTDTGFIKNGSFSEWEDGMPCNWIDVNIDDLFISEETGLPVYEDYGFYIEKTSSHGRNSSLMITYDIPDGNAKDIYKSHIAPGVYQILDLRDYEYGAEATFNYSVIRNKDFEYNDSYSQYAQFFIYRATYDEQTGEYSPYGGFHNYAYAKGVKIEDTWISYTDTATLNQGCYYVGFTIPVSYHESYTQSGVYDIPYMSGHSIVVDDVSLEIEAIRPIIAYDDLVENGSFESGFTNWKYDETVLTPTRISDNRPGTSTFGLGNYYCNIHYPMSVLDEDIRALYYGFKQQILSRSSSEAVFSFWHCTECTTPLDFRVCIYETIYNGSFGNYDLVEPPVFEDTVTTCNAGWDNYTKVIELDYQYNYTIVFYPPSDETSRKYGINLDKISLTGFVEKKLDHGTFANPVDSKYGYLSYKLNIPKANDSYTPAFYPYDSSAIPSKYFIKRGIYYYCTNGKTDEEGRFLCYSDEMVQSPVDLTGLRYFFKDGHMAIDTVFDYQGTKYRAYSDGSLKKIVLNVKNIKPDPYTEVFRIKTDEEITFVLTFDEQDDEVFLETEITNTAIATVTGVESGVSSNKITILGKSSGQTTFRAYHQNSDGTIAENIISIQVRDELAAEYASAKIYLDYEENSMLPGTSKKIDYYVLPEYLSDVPINWSSSKTNVATVDMNGNVLAISGGTCVITATNAYSNKSVSCTIQVFHTYYDPVSINVSTSEVNLTIGETTRVTSKVLRSQGDTLGVIQDVIWESSNTNIATVDKFGCITAINRGTAKITCKSATNNNISASIQVTVTGSKVEPQDIELDCYEIVFNYPYKNKVMKINHRFVPTDTNTSNDVVWSSSNPDYVRVTEGGYVYVPSDFDFSQGEIPVVYITCASASKRNMVKRCKITFSPTAEADKLVIKSFDTTLNTCVGRTLRINYDYLFNCEGGSVSSNWVYIYSDTSTTNEASLEQDSDGRYVEFIANEVGTFEVQIRLQCYYDTGITNCYRSFIVNVYEQDNPPILKDDLTVLYALQNDSCILRCKLEDEIDDLRNIDFYIDFNDGNGYESIIPYIETQSTNCYQYFFISGYKLIPNTAYQVSIKAIDSQGAETTTSPASLTIPKVDEKENNYKEQLANAKDDYESAIGGTFDIIDGLITSDSTMPDSNKAEFFIHYKIFCYNYENMRDMLDQCVKVINSQISTSQVEMATLSDALSSDGVSVAAYSEGDYTNSNYKSVTDMDYYQNECIKQLVARVLELEARLNELTSNNN